MLCQLVCVDRRYQRMNCFNIRELQGILKRKFFTDLVNTSDSHKAMEQTLINMRHKNNMSNILLYDQSLFYNFDLTNTSKSKTYNFSPGKIYTYTGLDFFTTRKTLLYSSYLNNVSYYNTFPTILKDFLSFIQIPSILTFSTLFNSLFYVKSTITNTIFFKTPSITNFILTSNTSNTEFKNTSYNSSTVNYLSFDKKQVYNFSENSSS
jgi:hypothetical protein